MASTETRTGFRLPWSSDHSDPEPTPAPAAQEERPAGTGDPGLEFTDDRFDVAGPDPAPAEDGPATKPITETAAEPIAETAAEPIAEAAIETALQPEGDAPYRAVPASQEVAAVSTVSTQAPSRRPTKFLADLTNAMRVAAEAEREEILGRFQAAAKAFTEELHGRSAGEAVELRKSSDDDISTIRDWSKAEIARLREETDRRVTARREQLEEELAAQAARIEHEIERVQTSVGAFEATMSRFFEDLLSEDDPTEFAARAANLPEPPSLDDVVSDAAYDAELEQIVGAAEPAAIEEPTTLAAVEGQAPIAEVPTIEGPAPIAEVPTIEWAASTSGTAGDPASAPEPEAMAAPEVAAAPEAAPEPGAVPETPATDPEVSDAVGAAATEPSTDPVGGETRFDPWGVAIEARASVDAAETVAGGTVDTAAEQAPGSTGTAAGWPMADEPTTVAETTGAQVDARVAALGLTPDLAAAEAEAASFDPEAGDPGSASNDPAGEPVESLDDASIAARLAGLPGADELGSTQLIVTGLISVASIAGFKRQVAGLAGVRSVGVSSGPDGEFVFAVSHVGGIELADAITTMPGFAARVTSSGEGVLHVAAHDPETA